MEPQHKEPGEVRVTSAIFADHATEDSFVLIFGIFGNAYRLSSGSRRLIRAAQITLLALFAIAFLVGLVAFGPHPLLILVPPAYLLARFLALKLIVTINRDPWTPVPFAKRCADAPRVAVMSMRGTFSIFVIYGLLLTVCCGISLCVWLYFLLAGKIAPLEGLIGIAFHIALLALFFGFHVRLKRMRNRQRVS